MTHLRARAITQRTLQITSNEVPDIEAGETLLIEIHRARSGRSHKHQFAWITEAWHSLPEEAQGLPWAETPETLRKHALIATGYHNSYTLDCESKASAERIRTHLLRSEYKAEGYAIGVVKGTVVTIWTPKSQSLKAMGGPEFQRSKEDIMDWIAAKVGTTKEELRKLQ